MVSATPKVLHEVGGRSLVGHVIAAASSLQPDHLVVVVGHGREQVAAHLAEIAPDAVVVVQEQQNGTGHAMRVALDGLAAAGVVLGDGPAARGRRRHARCSPARPSRAWSTPTSNAGASSTVLTARARRPHRLRPRPARPGTGHVVAIVEQKDADEAQRAVREINSGVYAFDVARADRRARPPHHRQRPGRGVPHRRRSASRSRRACRSRRSSRATPTRSSASTTARSSPRPRALLRDRVNLGLDARRGHDRRPGHHVDRRRRAARGRLRDRAQHQPARRRPPSRPARSSAPTRRSSTCVVGEGASVVRTPGDRRRDRPARHRRPVHLRAPRHQARREGQARGVRRDQERRGRRRVEGAAPVLRRRRRDRRAAPTSAPPPSSSTTTASTSTARPSATTSGSAATRCSSPR